MSGAWVIAARARAGPWAEAHLRHLGLAAFAIGLALAADPGVVAPVAAGVAVLAAGVTAPRAAVLTAGLVIAGAVAGGARLDAVDAPGAGLRPGDRIAGRATLVAPLQPGRFGSSATVRMREGPARGAKLVARLGRDTTVPQSVTPGAELVLRGSFRVPHQRPDADFDYRAYLKRQGVAGEIAVLEARATGRRRGGVAGAVDAARDRASDALGAGLSPARAALARGMVLGQDQRIDEATRDDFRASGLAHVLAVSGQNVMLLAALALPLLAVARVGPRLRLGLTAALIGLYVPLAGAGPSLQRAGVMGAAGLLALSLARPASRAYVVLLAAAATLAVNPRAVGDPGWQLSFAAVAGILVLAPPIRNALSALPRPAADGVATTMAATASTGPLIGHHFGSVSVASLPANVAALPLVAPIMWLGMVRGALGQLGAAARPLVDLLGLALAPLLGALTSVARVCAELPGGNPAVPLGSRASVAVAYGVLAASALGIRHIARRVDSQPARARWRRAPPARRLATLAVLLAVVALAAARLTAPPGPPSRFTVSYLDIGQGDATLIQAPGGTAVLFDGGPPEGRVTRLLRAAGVRRLALVVSTHQSRDHHEGLQAVAEQVPIGTLMENGDGTRDRTYWRMVATARRHGARVIEPVPGTTLDPGGGLRIRIYGPAPRAPGPPPADPNPRAIAAVVSYGAFDLFLSGDAESGALAAYDLPPVEAMKVSHHGSRDPGLPALLRRLRPRVAGIEVGRDNTYGHPTPQTLTALRRAHVATYRTDRDGTVKLTLDATGRMEVRRGG